MHGVLWLWELKTGLKACNSCSTLGKKKDKLFEKKSLGDENSF
jgi:hypothetical protein